MVKIASVTECFVTFCHKSNKNKNFIQFVKKRRKFTFNLKEHFIREKVALRFQNSNSKPNSYL